MSSRRWNLDTEIEDDDASSTERPTPTLVSMHFIRTALRRRLVACVLAAVLGLAAAGAILFAYPLPHQAKASLVLAYDPEVDPSRAMATNVSLLQTRTVAERATQELGLDVRPEDFLKSFTVEAESSELMTLTLSAPTDEEAVRQLEGLTRIYLAFRAEQLSLQSDTLVDGLQDQVRKLTADVRKLTRDINRLYAQGTGDAANNEALNDAIGQRTYLNGRIESLQQQVEDTSLRNSAVVAASRVLDPAAAQPGLAKRTMALILVSGLIGGAALGCGTVLFFAITSDKLRRRADVAGAIGVPVVTSVGRIAPVRAAWRWFPPLAGVDHRRAEERQRLARTIEDEVLTHPGRRIVIAGLDNTDEVGYAVADVAAGLAARDYNISVLDITERGSHSLTESLWTTGADHAPMLLRPRGLAALARGTGDLVPVGHWDDGESTLSPSLGDVTLVLADLDPAVGADHLTAWADQVLVVITAGRSGVEKIRTVGDMVRAAGLDLRFAALLRTEPTDDSSGTGPGYADSMPATPLAETEQPAPAAPRSEAR